ncbi:hypothetical protein [Nonomuraea rhodomycinica]|uniref:EfeO-type cupredoxin-like domain-containing protein n=1 Tax=Nonomuraea rhodomycinica TaxID=1712872 RepID=A0A7Y6INE6_9ACTN|nr:hypothetical protein [Nonomuraea rhodomycinica]NUW40104.1 hypothetical protein [Nonomuraea rhodomycinica]
MRRRLLGWAAVALLAAGCGPLSQTHHNPGNSHEVATAPPGAGGQGGEARAEITVRAGRVSPPSGWLEARRGQTVAITVTSDVADELHVHGYDRTAELRPGQAVTVRFRADMTGVFEVETHESGLVLTQVAVR